MRAAAVACALLVTWLVPPALGMAQPRAGEGRELRVAVEPSLQRSGLLDRLLPPFEAARGCRVVVRALAAKEALELGASGGADVVWVSAPRAEGQYLNLGFYLERRLVLYSEQVLMGPPGDPAGVRGSRDVVTAFRRIARRPATFVSRGERAESYAQERTIWRRAGVSPRAPWYVQVDLGKEAALDLAARRGAYTLADRATAEAPGSGLEIVLQGMRPLWRGYDVMTVNPNRFPSVNHADARALVDYLLSPAAQDVIGAMDLDGDGRPDFFPGAGRREPAS